MIDRKRFFAAVRSSMFRGSLNQGQVDGMNAILDEWDRRAHGRLEWLAYMLATVFHETARTMQPIEEYGKGSGRRYGVRDPRTGHAYYGRGFVQLTWKENYDRAGKKLGADFVNHPEKVMELDHATAILFDGMFDGWFTGKKLIDYIGPRGTDYRNARRIINGTDKASTIAGYARKFRSALAEVTERKPDQHRSGPLPKPSSDAVKGTAIAGAFAVILAIIADALGIPVANIIAEVVGELR